MPTHLPAAGNKPAPRLWCAQPVGLEWDGDGLVRFCSTRCLWGPLSGTQCVPDLGGLAHRPAKQDAALHGGQTPYVAAHSREQEEGAPGSKELDPAQHQVHPTLTIKGAPGPLGSREGRDQRNGV